VTKLLRLAIWVIGLIAPVAAYATPVTWSFYETGITSCNSPAPFSCVLPPQPFVLATLVLPGPTSAGTAIWDGVSPPVYTGDNFTLTVPRGAWGVDGVAGLYRVSCRRILPRVGFPKHNL
jgi:hypothetical protein